MDASPQGATVGAIIQLCHGGGRLKSNCFEGTVCPLEDSPSSERSSVRIEYEANVHGLLGITQGLRGIAFAERKSMKQMMSELPVKEPGLPHPPESEPPHDPPPQDDPPVDDPPMQDPDDRNSPLKLEVSQ